MWAQDLIGIAYATRCPPPCTIPAHWPVSPSCVLPVGLLAFGMLVGVAASAYVAIAASNRARRMRDENLKEITRLAAPRCRTRQATHTEAHLVHDSS